MGSDLFPTCKVRGSESSRVLRALSRTDVRPCSFDLLIYTDRAAEAGVILGSVGFRGERFVERLRASRQGSLQGLLSVAQNAPARSTEQERRKIPIFMLFQGTPVYQLLEVILHEVILYDSVKLMLRRDFPEVMRCSNKFNLM